MDGINFIASRENLKFQFINIILHANKDEKKTEKL
jgi:hypothetical protein